MTHRKLYLTKRSNQIWYLGWVEDGRRRWRSTKCTNKSDAHLFLREFQEADRKPRKNITLSECFQVFRETHGKEIRPSTLELCEWAVRAFLVVCKDKDLSAYSPSDIEHFKCKRLEAKSSITTINIYLRCVMSLFSFAVKKEMLAKSPLNMGLLLKSTKLPPAYISKDDFPKLLENTGSSLLREVFIFAASTGMRAGEIVNLKWMNVDMERRQVGVVSTETFLTKTGKSRVVPLNETAYGIVISRDQSRRLSEYVFHKGAYRIQRGYLSHSFKKVVRKAGLPEALRFHSLRHTFGSWCAQSNVPIYTIQALMGHSNVQTTAIYSHLAESHLHSAVDRISFENYRPSTLSSRG
ncbi:MAG: tyrosine-type recombinase/integrase [Bacteroidota bacterium]